MQRLWRGAGWWLLLLLQLGAWPPVHPLKLPPWLQEPEALLRPRDPNVAVNTSLTLTCTLKPKLLRNFTAADIRFKIDSDWLEGAEVESESTARLQWTRIPKRYNQKVLKCCVDAEVVAEAYVHVGQLPVKAEIVEPVILNWESLSFSWSLNGRRNPVFRTNYTAFWKRSRAQEWQQCAPQADFRCDVSAAAGYRASLGAFDLRVVANNIVGRAVTERAVTSVHIVRAAAVRNMSVQSDPETPRQLVVRFGSPKPTRTLVYQLSYTTQWSNQPVVTTHSTSTNPVVMKLEDVVPNTLHNVTVRAKYSDSQYWGPPTSLQYRTRKDKPGAAPAVTDGGFEVRQAQRPNRRDVIVHWKAVPPQELHGSLQAYKVTYKEAGSKVFQFAETRAPWTTLRELRSDADYFVMVTVINDEGEYSEEAIYGRTIPAQPLAVPPALNLTAIAHGESRVRLSWRPQPALTSVTLYWCLAENTQLHCRADAGLQWQETAAGAASHDVALAPEHQYTDYLFGVSLQRRAGRGRVLSSGINWTACTYKTTADVGQARVSVSEVGSGEVVLSIQPWLCRHHHGQAYIYAYRLVYCLGDADHGCTGPEQERVVASLFAKYLRLEGLEAGSGYLLRVYSLSAFRDFDLPTSLAIVTHGKGLRSAGALSGLLVGGLVLLVLLAAGVWGCKQCYETTRKKLEVPIHLVAAELDSVQSPTKPESPHKPSRPITLTPVSLPVQEMSEDTYPEHTWRPSNAWIPSQGAECWPPVHAPLLLQVPTMQLEDEEEERGEEEDEEVVEGDSSSYGGYTPATLGVGALTPSGSEEEGEEEQEEGDYYTRTREISEDMFLIAEPPLEISIDGESSDYDRRSSPLRETEVEKEWEHGGVEETGACEDHMAQDSGIGIDPYSKMTISAL